MRNCISFLSILLAVLPGFGALGSDAALLTEKTYCIGRTRSLGKVYRYCHLLTAEMQRGADDAVELTYHLATDQGKPINAESGQIKLNSKEIKPFSIILYLIWDAFYNTGKLSSPETVAFTPGIRGGEGFFFRPDDTPQLDVSWPDFPPYKSGSVSFSMEGICAILSLLSQTTEGKKVLGDGKKFRTGIRKKPVTLPFKEQEEIDRISSIIRKLKVGNWEELKDGVVYNRLDFRLLSDDEKHYLAVVFARHGPASETELNSEPKLRMDGDPSFIVRLKLDDPGTRKELREAFRGGYYQAWDASLACRIAANVKLLPIAAGFLFTDKAPKVVQMGDQEVEASPSIHSAAAIGFLLEFCPEFPEAVRKAAKTWDRNAYISPQFVPPCRKWWRENQQRIEKGLYDEVTAPPSRE